MDEQRDFASGAKLNLTPKQALERVIDALKEEGFGVLTSVDVKATLKEKLRAIPPLHDSRSLLSSPAT